MFRSGPLTAPLNLRVSDIESTQVTLHWDSVTRGSMMGELKEYKVWVYYIYDRIMAIQITFMMTFSSMKEKLVYCLESSKTFPG